MTSPSISSWHCWHVVNEYMTMSICDIKLTSGSWDSTNKTLISSWYLRDNRRYSTAKFVLCQKKQKKKTLKIKASGDLFYSCCYEKFVKYLQTALIYLKGISNIVSGNTYWESCNKMWSNQVQMYTAHSAKLRPEDLTKRILSIN